MYLYWLQRDLQVSIRKTEKYNKMNTSTSPGTGKKTVFLVLVLTTIHLSYGFSSASIVPSSLSYVGISSIYTMLETNHGNCLFCFIFCWFYFSYSFTFAASCLILFISNRNWRILLSIIRIRLRIYSSVRCFMLSLISANTAESIIFKLFLNLQHLYNNLYTCPFKY